ncbi:uncharacterized protein METZ01_LOCUS181601 [marine metagenome]|uniref:Uncharacterized protein n=1 Tax=marine metagenome TaxID=408172 RepID=A0A382CTX0_9ZZZZ
MIRQTVQTGSLLKWLGFGRDWHPLATFHHPHYLRRADQLCPGNS